MDTITLRVAAKAIIVNDEGQVLILREASTYKDGTNVGKYHVPGGRIETGERFMDALHREVQEETGLSVEPLYPVHVDEWHPIIRGEQQQIIGVFLLCKAKAGEVRVSDEHDEFVWVDPKEAIDEYELLPAERNAIDNYLKRC